MIKDTLELFRKKTIENVGDFILKTGKETTRKDVLDSAERAFLTSHISYLDKKILEIQKEFGILGSMGGSLGYQGMIMGIQAYQLPEDIMRDKIIYSLQKEKSQAEGLLKGL